jgi:Druantia protein DruA
MSEDFVLQGRRIGPKELQQLRQLLAHHPEWSRFHLSRELAELWNWRNPLGQLKDMAARSLLLKLEQRGCVQLPVRRRASPNRMRQKRSPISPEPVSATPLCQSLDELLPLNLAELSQRDDSNQRRIFEALLHQHHYLSYRSPVGENLQYLVRDRQERLLACVLFGAPAWQCRARDQYVGWDARNRQAALPYVANNTRFLILPWVRVHHLASHVLGAVSRRLNRDWQRKYGHLIYLLETFVERECFAGTAYRAANWICVGQTQGRGRQGPDPRIRSTSIKDVYVFPLQARFRERLREPSVNSIPHPSP